MNQKICPASYNNLHLNCRLFVFLRRSPHFGLYNYYDILLISPLIKVYKIANMVLLSFFLLTLSFLGLFSFVIIFSSLWLSSILQSSSSFRTSSKLNQSFLFIVCIYQVTIISQCIFIFVVFFILNNMFIFGNVFPLLFLGLSLAFHDDEDLISQKNISILDSMCYSCL